MSTGKASIKQQNDDEDSSPELETIDQVDDVDGDSQDDLLSMETQPFGDDESEGNDSESDNESDSDTNTDATKATSRRKLKTDEEEQQEEAPPKRGRGRPRKPESERKSQPNPDTPKRGRGRPRKHSVNPPPTSPNTPKRGRGRPRKRQLEEVTDEPGTDAQGVAIPKRGRGRPRKIQKTSDSQSPELPKRGRGRPRKNSAPLDSPSQSPSVGGSRYSRIKSPRSSISTRSTTKQRKSLSPPSRRSHVHQKSKIPLLHRKSLPHVNGKIISSSEYEEDVGSDFESDVVYLSDPEETHDIFSQGIAPENSRGYKLTRTQRVFPANKLNKEGIDEVRVHFSDISSALYKKHHANHQQATSGDQMEDQSNTEANESHNVAFYRFKKALQAHFQFDLAFIRTWNQQLLCPTCGRVECHGVCPIRSTMEEVRSTLAWMEQVNYHPTSKYSLLPFTDFQASLKTVNHLERLTNFTDLPHEVRERFTITDTSKENELLHALNTYLPQLTYIAQKLRLRLIDLIRFQRALHRFAHFDFASFTYYDAHFTLKLCQLLQQLDENKNVEVDELYRKAAKINIPSAKNSTNATVNGANTSHSTVPTTSNSSSSVNGGEDDPMALNDSTNTVPSPTTATPLDDASTISEPVRQESAEPGKAAEGEATKTEDAMEEDTLNGSGTLPIVVAPSDVSIPHNATLKILLQFATHVYQVFASKETANTPNKVDSQTDDEWGVNEQYVEFASGAPEEDPHKVAIFASIHGRKQPSTILNGLLKHLKAAHPFEHKVKQQDKESSIVYALTNTSDSSTQLIVRADKYNSYAVHLFIQITTTDVQALISLVKGALVKHFRHPEEMEASVSVLPYQRSSYVLPASESGSHPELQLTLVTGEGENYNVPELVHVYPSTLIIGTGDDGTVVRALLTYAKNEEIYVDGPTIQWISVRKPHRGRGIASSLISWIQKTYLPEVWQIGAKSSTLYASYIFNAHMFFLKQGFRFLDFYSEEASVEYQRPKALNADTQDDMQGDDSTQPELNKEALGDEENDAEEPVSQSGFEADTEMTETDTQDSVATNAPETQEDVASST